MKKPNDADKSKKTPEKPDGFHERAKSIRNRLDRADEIFDNMETKKRKPAKAEDTFQEVAGSIESGLKKLFRSASTQIKEFMNEGKQPEAHVRENLAQYLRSCSDEQLMEVRSEIERLLRERGDKK